MADAARWVDVCAVDDLLEEEPLAVTDPVAGRLAVFRVGEEYFVLQDRCTHQEARLSDGFVEGCAVECPLHASVFDLRTGQPDAPPASTPVQTFPVHVSGGRLMVDVGLRAAA